MAARLATPRTRRPAEDAPASTSAEGIGAADLVRLAKSGAARPGNTEEQENEDLIPVYIRGPEHPQCSSSSEDMIRRPQHRRHTREMDETKNQSNESDARECVAAHAPERDDDPDDCHRDG